MTARTVAAALGLTAAAVAAGAEAGLLVLPAAVAVLAAIRWPAAATAAGGLLVAAVAVEPVGPVAAAVTAAILTGYLLIVDAGHPRPGLVPSLVGVAAIAATVLATVLATGLPHPPWMAPLGMAAAATATLLTVATHRRRAQTSGGAG
jgi:hypothetical protein